MRYKGTTIYHREKGDPPLIIKSSIHLAETLRDLYFDILDEIDAHKEHVVCVYLNAKNEVKEIRVISIGTLQSAKVNPREVFKPAVLLSAAKVLLAHNHPAGSVEASQEDYDITKKLKEAGEILGIGFEDHIIIGEGRKYISLMEE